MNGLVHPFSRALYEQDGNGNVRVTKGEQVGLFTAQGRWLSGDIEEADPQLCGWVAGPIIGNHRVTASVKHE